MVQVPEPKTVELEDEYYHVRFRDPDEFSEIRTPDWATTVAEDVEEESKVRMGQRDGNEDWVVQSVLIPKSAEKSAARSKAKQIVEKIES